MEHIWSTEEIGELLQSADGLGTCWAYCCRCGVEIAPVEPDATTAWCEVCGREVTVEGLGRLGLI